MNSATPTAPTAAREAATDISNAVPAPALAPEVRAMRECPRWDRRIAPCEAPICVLDPDYRRRTHLQGERICFYLREAVKHGAAELFKPRADEDIFRAAVKVLSAEEPLDSDIEKRLHEAKESGSTIKRGSHLVSVADGR